MSMQMSTWLWSLHATVFHHHISDRPWDAMVIEITNIINTHSLEGFAGYINTQFYSDAKNIQ